MIYTLEQIEQKYKEVDKMKEPTRTNQLVILMNLLEQQYRTFKLDPSADFMETEEVKLYKKISNARVFQED
ncbi:hypothetical protein HCJ46_17170 [Listeria booriae]|uniref:hypothetical protein n=1 Tax=Listeria booriae TaxID=1552123 RepID=UPI0016266FEE|nr:hypothetical protein [Listeria booriae]MBC1920485.1 hypothetical protein [Listeria booriae]